MTRLATGQMQEETQELLDEYNELYNWEYNDMCDFIEEHGEDHLEVDGYLEGGAVLEEGAGGATGGEPDPNRNATMVQATVHHGSLETLAIETH